MLVLNSIFSDLGSCVSAHRMYPHQFKALLLQEATNQTIRKMLWESRLAKCSEMEPKQEHSKLDLPNTD